MASAVTLKMPVDAAPTLALHADDPFFLVMDSGRIHWGDLMSMSTTTIEAELAKPDERVVEWWSNEHKAAERLENWEVPDLTLRSGIEEHFPVVLQPLPASEDGHERFVVKFDDRVDMWATTRAESQDECMEYADWVQTRLIFALRQYAHKYILESEGGEGCEHVAIFAMAHPSAAARRARAAIPTLSTFPVTWEQDRADHTRHLVKIHQKRIAEEEIDPIALADAMMTAMTACTDCTFELITTMGSPHLFTVTIPTAPPPKRYVCTCVHCGGGGAPAAAPSAPRPAPLLAPAPRPASAAVAAAPPAMGGAGGPRHKPFIPVLQAKNLLWKQDDLDRSVHMIKREARGYRKLSADEQNDIIRELRTCTDCRVETCSSSDRMFFCIVTKLR